MLAIIYFSLSNGVWPFDEVAVFRTVATAAFVAAAWVGLWLIFTARPIPEVLKRDSQRVLKRVLAFFVSMPVVLLVVAIPGLNIFAALWIIPFLWCAFWLMSKHLFGAGDAHPMLAPLVAATTCAVLSIYNLSTIHASKIPPRIDELIVLSGLGTTVLLSLVELLALMHNRQMLAAGPAEAAAAGPATATAGPIGYSPPNVHHGYHGSPHRRRSRFPVKTALVIALILALPLLWLVAEGVAGHAGGGAPPPQSNTLGQPGNPARGTLTIRPNHDYILAVGSPYPIARIGGADVGHLTGTPDGLDVADAYVLPLPRAVTGNYDSCLALDWTGTKVWGVGHVIPCAKLRPGRQFCVQTTYSGLFISLLTVNGHPAHGRVTFKVATWACNARPGESAIC
jgi:hypothetical protein